jgi:hypothetical protein
LNNLGSLWVVFEATQALAQAFLLSLDGNRFAARLKLGRDSRQGTIFTSEGVAQLIDAITCQPAARGDTGTWRNARTCRPKAKRQSCHVKE